MPTGESNSHITDWTQDIHQGDAIETLSELPESSVHCVMTSPPYFGLRDYGVDGQIGLEESLDEYIQNLVTVGEELRRVLRDDGSWWLNLGDSFAGSWGAQSKDETENNLPQHDHPDKNPARNAQLRRKNKMFVPHRVAIALQDAGWIARSDTVWAKPNPMPHPVKDRLNEHKEFIFHLTPNPDYWFDLDAIREPHQENSLSRAQRGRGDGKYRDGPPGQSKNSMMEPADTADTCHQNGKNPGDIFEVPVKPFPEAHFAVYPEELCKKPLKAACPPTVCAACGAPYERVTEDVPKWEQDRSEIDRPQLERALAKADKAGLTDAHLHACRAVGFSDAAAGKACQTGAGNNRERVEELAAEAKAALGGYFREFATADIETAGWEQSCACATDETEPGIVLDPFAGAGTTCLVAKQLTRRFIGIDLNPEYVALAQKRVGVTVDEPDRLPDIEGDQEPLTAYGGE